MHCSTETVFDFGGSARVHTEAHPPTDRPSQWADPSRCPFFHQYISKDILQKNTDFGSSKLDALSLIEGRGVIGRFAIAAVALTLVAGTAFEAKATEYIQNGGFETGTFADWACKRQHARLHDLSHCANSLSSAVGYGPNSGTYFAYLGTNPASTISQSFADIAGQTLGVSFYFASNGGSKPHTAELE